MWRGGGRIPEQASLYSIQAPRPTLLSDCFKPTPLHQAQSTSAYHHLERLALRFKRVGQNNTVGEVVAGAVKPGADCGFDIEALRQPRSQTKLEAEQLLLA